MKDIKIYAFADEASPQIDQQIIALNRNGLNGLEMRNVDGVNVSDITLEKAKEVKSKLDLNGLNTWSIGSPIGKIDIEKDDFEAHKDKLKHTLEIANILDAKYIRMFSFFIPKDKVVSDYKNEVQTPHNNPSAPALRHGTSPHPHKILRYGQGLFQDFPRCIFSRFF